jgi:hypothetical protein
MYLGYVTHRSFNEDGYGVDEQHANHNFLKGVASNKLLHSVERVRIVKRWILFKP